MSVKLLENASFNVIRTNVKLSTNTKLVVDTTGGLFLESFDANEELSKSRYKSFRVSSTSSYEYDLSRFYKNTPSDTIFQVKRDDSDLSILNDYSKQYEVNYSAGAEAVNSLAYNEEFGILAPIWLEKNIPNYFVIFRIDEPVSINNIDALTENENKDEVNNPLNFVDNILKKAVIIKTVDLTLNSEAGKYIRKYRNSERFPQSPVLFNSEKHEQTHWNGINLKEGGFTSKPEYIYENFINKDNTIIEQEFYITQGFERNNIACANLLNMYFLFDDTDAKDFTINRYFGIYVNDLDEGTFQVSGKELYMDSFYENQIPKPTSNDFLVKNNTADLIQTNQDGIVLYIDKNTVESVYTEADTDNDTSIDLKSYHFLPKQEDVQEHASIFYVKDKDKNFYNLNIGGQWEHINQLRLKTDTINWKNFTGIEKPVATRASRISSEPGKACTFIKINSAIPHGDKYFSGIVNKQIYKLVPKNIIPGDIFTITDDTGTSITINAVSNNSNDLLLDILNAWKNESFGKFKNFSVSIDNGLLLAIENKYTGVDVNFSIGITGSSLFDIVKDTSADLEHLTITASTESGIAIGEANERFFNPNGTPKEIARAMATAFNNIKDRFFEATNVNDLVVLVSRNTGTRFNQIAIGRDLFFTGSHSEIISNEIGFTHQDFSIRYYEGGNTESLSRVHIDIKSFNDFNVANRYIKTVDRTGKETGLSLIKKVSYYIDEPVKNKNGKIVGYNNIDNLCTIIVEDKTIIFRDSIKHVYLYELFKIPFGRFSIFPIKDIDVDFYSTEYGDERELNIESTYYKTFGGNGDITQTDIEDFYENNEFSTLHDLLEIESPDRNTVSPKIELEYDRLKENYIKELTTPSRISPYVNKWVYRNGKDCRDHDYRLSMSESFGITNFSPSSLEFNRNPNYFTHEWYYLQKLPLYFGLYDRSNLNNVFSYFPDKIDVTTTGLLSNNFDYFTEYFTVDVLKYPILDTSNQILSEELVPIKRQLRYGVFDDGTDVNFSTAFLRGVKILAKERTETSTLIDYNLQNIKFKESNKYNDYKFSTVLIPHNGQYPANVKRKSVEIEFIENSKFKNITLVVYVKIEDLTNRISKDISSVTVIEDAAYIDRTILYAVNSKFKSILTSDPLNIEYEDVTLTGAIDMRLSSGTNFSLGEIFGTESSANESTLFIDEIALNKDGSYNSITAISGSVVRNLQVNKVVNNTFLKAVATGGPQPNALNNSQVRNGTYIYKEGGYNFWNQRLNKVSFASIANLINNGSPDIKYTTLLEDGTIVNNLFVIELQTPNHIIKPSYINVIPDNNKPVNFNLTDTIGYSLIVGTIGRVQPIYRHDGTYQPKFIDIINFEDPYISIDYTNPAVRENQIKNFIRDKNTQFKIENTFGLIKNMFYHKINDRNNKGVLELTKNNNFNPRYPLIGEIAIDKKDFYVFSSNWDSGYFDKYSTKTISEPVIGTRGILEKKSFFASKIMKIVDELQIETFDAIEAANELELETIGKSLLRPDNQYEIVYLNKPNSIIIDIYLEKRLIEVLDSSGVRSFFEKYVKPGYGFGKQDTLDDDIRGYIVDNILPRYKVDIVELYVNKSRDNNLNLTQPIVNSSITDIAKNINGMATVKDFSSSSLSSRSLFNIRIIYNKLNGYYYSVAPSIKIIKK